jgi:uncharacterized membrane protein YeaQ/YmgE (transglycosylase-associated protein family)
MDIASWIIVGLVTGSIARIAMPGPAAGGMPVAILIGVVGAFIGGLLGTTISPDTAAPFNLYASSIAAIGAMILLFLYRCVAMRFEENQFETRPMLFAKSGQLVIESDEMIRVTFDRHYMDNLDDYYQRNECIREQQYLSHDKLLHLAAFCVLKAVIAADERGDTRWNEPKAEAALDAIRQLSLLCEKAVHGKAQIEPVTIVNGQANGERQNQERCATPSVPTT